MHRIFYLLLFLFSTNCFTQTLPLSRSVDWTLAGLREMSTSDFIEVDMQGAVGDGVTPNDAILEDVISSILGSRAILKFPAGNFLFNNTIHLPSNIIIKGDGAKNTSFDMDLGGAGDAISIRGIANNAITSSITDFADKDNDFVIVSDANDFSVGDWIQIIQEDSDLVTSSWAENTVGQVVKIKSIFNNKILLESPLRMDFDIVRSPYLLKINPVNNVGIECLKIHRLDDTAPEQSSNVNFTYAVNCWVKGVESENCTFSHIEASHSSNLYFSESYFHHAFGYGGGGRAYGVLLQASSNECLVENNIFEHLRHSMIVQSGANGNVFSYNYSLDPYWDAEPNGAAGDIVLHGNYPYANLFESNICRNIIIDNSHGPNGPHNTIFRNRADGYGIFFSSSNSPNQNFIGNEITNTNFPFFILNYTIKGAGQFLHGNNNKGTIHPQGTNTINELSYTYFEKPDFVTSAQWAGIGTPNVMGSNYIPAYDRFNSESIFNDDCNELSVDVDQDLEVDESVIIFPNPIESNLIVESNYFMQRILIIDLMGQVLLSYDDIGFSKNINTEDWRLGAYIILINFSGSKSLTKVVVKINH